MNARQEILPGARSSMTGTRMCDRPRQLEVSMRRQGARTFIDRQFVTYPYHLTRPFLLDAGIPQLLTLYQQSCSGGLYRGEQLACRYDLEQDAAAHITTQSATVVHDCHGQMARNVTDITLRSGAFLALMPEPMVLFPGALCESAVNADLCDDAVLVVADVFARHDPFRGVDNSVSERVFAEYRSEIAIRDAAGRLRVRESSSVTGDAVVGRHPATGRWPIVSSFILAGEASRLPSPGVLAELVSGPHFVACATELPNQAGWSVRCLAGDAVAARGFADRLFDVSVRAAFGESPARRRK